MDFFSTNTERTPYNDKFLIIKSFQSLLFSTSNHEEIRLKIQEVRNELTSKEIDHQLILAFSLDYSKIPTLTPFLSTTTLQAQDFVHFDQELFNSRSHGRRSAIAISIRNEFYRE